MLLQETEKYVNKLSLFICPYVIMCGPNYLIDAF